MERRHGIRFSIVDAVEILGLKMLRETHKYVITSIKWIDSKI